MSNLIAYISALNQRHIDWLRKHRDPYLFLITQEMAGSLVPRLSRNVGAVKEMEIMVNMISSLDLVRSVDPFYPEDGDPELRFSRWSKWVLPNEDVSHALAEKYLLPAGCSVQFEDIWARYDMTAVKRQMPVMEDVESTTNHGLQMAIAKAVAPKSPDWWRQIGAALFVNEVCVSVACNNHFPTEYVTDIFGDPRMNVDAGQIGKYVSFHAEKTVIVDCASKGISTKGASLYTTVFPCEDCARAIVLAGIDHLFFEEGYSTLDAREVLEGAGVKIVRVVKDPEAA